MNLIKDVREYILLFLDAEDLTKYESTCKTEFQHPYQNVWKHHLLNRVHFKQYAKWKKISIDDKNYKKMYIDLVLYLKTYLIYRFLNSENYPTIFDYVKNKLSRTFPLDAYSWLQFVYDGTLPSGDPIRWIDMQYENALKRGYVLNKPRYTYKKYARFWKTYFSDNTPAYRHVENYFSKILENINITKSFLK
jgi:hypothetical protein